MNANELTATILGGVHDMDRFRRELADWLEHPFTARLMASLGRMHDVHIAQLMKPISKDEQIRFHNPNCDKANVYGDILTAIDGLTGKGV